MRNRTETVSADRLLRCFAVLCCTTSVAMAGPNAGGVLLVHDTGVAFSSDTALPPVTPLPAGCSEVDTNAPCGSSTDQRIWKVYASFPPASAPRLKGASWGIGITSVNAGSVYVAAAGLPHPMTDFEITYGGWPYTDGASIGQSFSAGPQLTTMAELYWFAGYGYLGAGGEPQFFCTQPHAGQPSVFVDDSTPPQADPIGGWGCLGFGANGSVPCPGEPGICCIATTCVLTNEQTCLDSGGTFLAGGTICAPNPCIPNGVGDAGLAATTTLRAAPNPFTGSTTLHLAGSPATSARVLIFDAAGRLVRTAWEGNLDGREMTITWDGTDQSGRETPAGIYLIRVESAAPSRATPPKGSAALDEGTPVDVVARLLKIR